MLTRCLATLALGAGTAASADPRPGVDSLVGAERDLTFDLAKRIAPSDNAIFSPASIHVALGMTYAGARGTTAADMARVLHFDHAGGDIHALFGALGASLAKLEHKDQAFHMVNRLFGQTSYPWSKDFLALTDKRYGAALEPVDFGDSEPVRKHINGWVEDQTNKKIKDLLPPSSLTPDTRMVLTNAVYFKGQWQHPFDKAATKDADFFARGKTAAKTKMMHQTDHFLLGTTADAQVLEMPYAHGDIAMDIILPKAKDGLGAVEGKLDGTGLVKLLGTMKRASVDVAMPKFKVKTTVEMKEMFKKLGMILPFRADADFSGMVARATEPLYIDQIYHQGFVDLDENGTEAAAATAVVMVSESAEPVEQAVPFTADHPFVWMIRDVATGEILFYGRIVDPR
jgi:serpin B